MSTPKVSTLSHLVMTLVAAGLITAPGSTLATKPDPKLQQMSSAQAVAQKIKPAQRQAAADRLKAAKAAATAAGLPAAAALVTDPLTGALVPDYFGGIPNWAYSPLLTKFVDALPDLKGLIATPDKVTFPDSEYYEIELIEYSWKFHTDLGQNTTKLRGYRQTNIIDPAKLPCAPMPTCGYVAYASLPPPSYLGPVIVSTKGTPTRIKFTNNLPAGASGNLFIPTDTSVMGAGMGPDGTNYPQNRATLHLHGGFTPWVSDGTPHQWVTPAGETAALKRGVSTQDVPDMNLSSGNSMTFYWPNQQSGRLMFYHDHAYGITRLNVYAGEAAGYLLYDPAEEALLATAGVPGTLADLPHLQPLVIQDRTFVWGQAPLPCGATTPGTGTFATDPTWCDPTKPWGQVAGSLWFPHVYMPNQNPWDVSGANAMGRWDYALWFWPPFTGLLNHGTLPNPYAASPGEPPEIPGTPNPSLVPEAFMDTPVVNGKAYPTLTVDATKYQLRILNAANDRFWNLSLFVAADKTTPTTAGTTGAALCVDNSVVLPANCTEVKMVPFNSSQHAITPFPDWWYTPGLNFTFDDRTGGVPDPTTRGPAMIQIGTEAGILPAPAVIPNQPVNYTYNRKDIVVLSVQEHALLLGPAERADVIVDFTNFAGKTLILYNDGPAPIPAADQRLDYFTGNPVDQTTTGGAPTTLPGMGPNTRTIMQIVVNGTSSGVIAAADNDYVDPVFLAALSAPAPAAGLPAAFAASQDPIILPQAAYNSAYGTSVVDVPGANLSRIADTSLTFTPLGGSSLTLAMGSKAIQELFELDYGRMNATLGVEVPFTNGGNQTTIPLGYIDPTTEFIAPSASIAPPTLGDGTQIWKITHNGVDTHPIHFHLFNVQVINRVGWDGAIRSPDANEVGWKETVRMNPLEDIIVAMRPTTPKLPFGLPDSIRPMDVTMPLGSTGQFTNTDPLGNPVTIVNALNNFNWEYVWHCHLLGHEENDMMRPIEFQVTSLVPAAPPGLTAVAGAPAPAVVLAWTDPTPWNPATQSPQSTLGNTANEVGFTVQRATNSSFSQNLKAFTVKANATSFADTSTQSNIRYYYRVGAFNAAGASPWSNAVNLTTAAGAVPAAPTGLSAAVMSATQVRLSWTDNSTNETGFIVERAVNGGAFVSLSAVAAHTSSGAMTFNDNTVVTGNTYAYQVKAVNGATSSGYSNTASVTTSIAAPTNLNGALLSATSVRLTWTDNANNEANYKVERSPDSVTWTPLAMLAANTLTYTDAAVPASPPGPATYVFRVTAVNGATSSASALTTVGIAVPPAAPSNLLAAGVALNGNNRAVVLNWNDNANNETGFTIQRCTGTTATTCGPAGGWANVTTTVAANATTFQDTGVVRKTTYSYRIQAVNALGVSAWSSVAAVTTP